MSAVAAAPVRLYCVPHAGATTSVFRGWQDAAPPGVTVVGIDRPGRGTRSREPRASGLDELLAATARVALDDLERARAVEPGVRWATFGHSFGATVSLDLAVRLHGATGRPPAAAVLSAALPPSLQPAVDVAAGLTDAELLDRIRSDGGTPEALLAVPAMAALLVDAMREDHAVRRAFPGRAGLRAGFGLTLVAARDDPHVTPEQMWRWADHGTGPCRRVELDGGHFAAVRDPGRITALVQASDAAPSGRSR